VELRLPPTPTGDLPDPGDLNHGRGIRVIERSALPTSHLPPRYQSAPTQIHATATPDFIPADTKRKLRDLSLNSKDP
jgi:hypothetical protein